MSSFTVSTSIWPPHPQPHHLTVLEPYFERARTQLERAPVVYQSLVAVTPKRLKQCSHRELRAVGNHFGAFYTRLADVTRLPLPELQTDLPGAGSARLRVR